MASGHNYSLEHDLSSADWILNKVRASESYAQNLYAAMCNAEFQKLDVIPILKEERWSCSWRYAGGIIAQLRNSGDYMDWYCSGMGGFATLDSAIDEEIMAEKKYVAEGIATDEIRNDLKKLGWVIVTN